MSSDSFSMSSHFDEPFQIYIKSISNIQSLNSKNKPRFQTSQSSSRINTYTIE